MLVQCNKGLVHVNKGCSTAAKFYIGDCYGHRERPAKKSFYCCQIFLVGKKPFLTIEKFMLLLKNNLVAANCYNNMKIKKNIFDEFPAKSFLTVKKYYCFSYLHETPYTMRMCC